MKIIVGIVAVFVLAILTYSISAPMHSTRAYASKFDGKGRGCSDRICAGINSPNYGKKKNRPPASQRTPARASF
ncbi:hypothetical protein [Bradyrhizobium sp. NAS80.1]|uniref:hypothetical protein n=1 Tax=Bradyrhizobium sp. NAS80.1 TaxID=1680159 RepID=UPI0011610E22|nr:hypothetical protein [Bradyrhizobium sp. NAS80.1]